MTSAQKLSQCASARLWGRGSCVWAGLAAWQAASCLLGSLGCWATKLLLAVARPRCRGSSQTFDSSIRLCCLGLISPGQPGLPEQLQRARTSSCSAEEPPARQAGEVERANSQQIYLLHATFLAEPCLLHLMVCLGWMSLSLAEIFDRTDLLTRTTPKGSLCCCCSSFMARWFCRYYHSYTGLEAAGRRQTKLL